MRVVAITVLLAPVLVVILSGCGDLSRPGLARGAELYDTCEPCHGPHGAGTPALGAPAIAGLPRWYVEAQLGKFQTGMRGAHPDDSEGARMRPMARSLHIEGDVASVAQYVASLPARPAVTTLAGGDPAAGAARYTTICVACHGADASGMEAMGAPALANQPDWYMLRQLEKFKSGMRGADTRDVQGGQMAAMSSTLEDHQAMMDVIAYIRTLRK